MGEGVMCTGAVVAVEVGSGTGDGCTVADPTGALLDGSGTGVPERYTPLGVGLGVTGAGVGNSVSPPVTTPPPPHAARSTTLRPTLMAIAPRFKRGDTRKKRLPLSNRGRRRDIQTASILTFGLSDYFTNA